MRQSLQVYLQGTVCDRRDQDRNHQSKKLIDIYSASYVIAHNVFNVLFAERHLLKVNSTAFETLSNVGKYLL